MSSSSSISDPNPNWIYDVYLSFYGKATCKTFALDLDTALLKAGVSVFWEEYDDKLRSDQNQIPLSVRDAIEGSRISIIIFSRNYADSRWHLQELEKIMECHRTIGQIVVPIFYEVHPSDVGNQTGIFGSWRDFMREVSTIPGYAVMDSRNQSNVIKEAVAHVTNLLDLQQKDLFVAEHTLEVEYHVQVLIQLLTKNEHTDNEVILQGLWGMGGIGKTTIAKAVYNQICRNFEAKSFLLNVREVFERYGPLSLQERLLSDICKVRTTGIKSITMGQELLKGVLSQKRILLVLDDVDNMEQLSALWGSREWFGSGSMIIITTRNRLLLDMYEVDYLHMVTALGHEPKVYEVFLSFRGEDTRASFVAHLHTSLQNAGLHVFNDNDEIQRGDLISLSLLQAIRKTRIAIIVLSRNYANSRWCMIELEKIMEICRTKSLVVVPVFYGVDPSEVRNQTGEFGKAFNELIRRTSTNANKVRKWKRDLLEVGGRAGIVVINSRNESEDIKKVLEHVTDLLGKTDLFVAEHPVGVESRVQEVVKWLNCQQSNDVLLLGIWGMGGIGKTTIAKATYNKVRHNFEAKSFLLNVREAWKENNGQVSLQQRLLSDVYKTTKIKIDTVESGKSVLKERLRQKKIFLVLDDVNEWDQLSALCGSHEWFGEGSRIIITTRDEDMLHRLKDEYHIYIMEKMDDKESLELFSWHAFKQASPKEGFAELSRDVVKYSGGLPLALQVIGSFLLNRGKREWKSVLEKLKLIPDKEVLAKLKISFDGLKDDTVKELFLDIAFFFIGMDCDDVTKILNDCGLFPVIGISILIQQSLVTVDNKNRLEMHDLIRDMGREIVREKSPHLAAKRSRLWHHEDVLDVLSKDTRAATIKGLTLKLPSMDTMSCLNSKAFEKLERLRLLQLAGVQLDGDFKYLSTDLRWLCWHGFPLKYTPLDFHQANIVAMELKYSSLERVWKKSQMLKKLKLLNLSHSPNLRQTPDFSNLPNLEKLILKDCPSLTSISHTIGDLCGVLLINLKGCTNLRTLPRNIYKLKSLKTLILSGCSKIDKLEEDIEHMESLTTLVADKTDIKKVPFAVVRLKSIAYISLCGFEGLSRDVFPSLVWSWMSPTSSVLSVVQTSTTMLSRVYLDEQDRCFHGLSSVIKDLQKLQRIWVKCESEIQLNQNVERILNTLGTNCEELEATPSTSSAFVDCGIQIRRTSSKKFLMSLLIQMGMNCHITSILRENILQKLPAIGPGVLPGDNYPNWLTFIGEGSSVSFDVPEVIERDLKTIMCVVDFSSPDNITSEGLQNVLVINYTKTTFQLYKRDGLASLEEEDEWQKVVSNIEPGDKVKIFIILGGRLTVNKTAVYFIYDEPIKEKTKRPLLDKSVIASGDDENRIGRLFFGLPSLVQAILISRPFIWFGLIGTLVWSYFHLYKRRSCNLYSRYAILWWKWLVNYTNKHISYQKANKSAQCN